MFDALIDQATGFSLGIGLGMALKWAINAIPKMIDDIAGRYLDKALDIRNPEDKELVLALVKWAEAKIPDRGKGVEKYKLVAKQIVKLIPMMSKHEDRISSMIEEGVSQLDDTLKERLPKQEG